MSGAKELPSHIQLNYVRCFVGLIFNGFLRDLPFGLFGFNNLQPFLDFGSYTSKPAFELFNFEAEFLACACVRGEVKLEKTCSSLI